MQNLNYYKKVPLPAKQQQKLSNSVVFQAIDTFLEPKCKKISLKLILEGLSWLNEFHLLIHKQ